MREKTIPESPEGRHVHPWLAPAQPSVEKRTAPAAQRSLQRVVSPQPASQADDARGVTAQLLGKVTRPLEGRKPKLLDQVREAIRTRHYSLRTEDAYVGWIRRFILFHGKRHSLEMGQSEITQFLSALAVRDHVSASTQNQALCALLFLYREVLAQDMG